MHTFFFFNLIFALMSNEFFLVEAEYKKLLSAWDAIDCLNRSSLSVHLFSNYLDQIWIESQNMLQCAQYWQAAQKDILDFSDAVHTMNSLGLHLMKQSLHTRQELINIVQYIESDDKDSFYSATSGIDIAEVSYRNSISIREMKMGQPLSASRSLIRLMRSPSAPTQRSSEDYFCTPDPSSHYTTYLPTDQNNQCHFCSIQQIKRSYSFEHFQTSIDDMHSDISSESFTYYRSKGDEEQRKMDNIHLEKYPSLAHSNAGYDIPCQTLSDVSTLSLTSVRKPEMITLQDSNTFTTPLFEESAYMTEATVSENLFCEKPETNTRRSSTSTYKTISSTLLHPLWTIKLALKKRSQKTDNDQKGQTRTRKFVSKFRFKK